MKLRNRKIKKNLGRIIIQARRNTTRTVKHKEERFSRSQNDKSHSTWVGRMEFNCLVLAGKEKRTWEQTTLRGSDSKGRENIMVVRTAPEPNRCF